MRTLDDTGKLRICSGYTVDNYLDADTSGYLLQAIVDVIGVAARDFPQVKKAIRCVGISDNMVARCRAELDLVGADGDKIVARIGITRMSGMCYLPRIEGRDKASKILSRYCGIYMTRSVLEHIEEFEEKLRRSISAGWISIGSGDIRQAIAHEVGHAIDYALRLSEREEIIQIYLSNITAMGVYASSDIREYIAECYAEYATLDTPCDIAVQVVETIQKIISDYDLYKR
ncbi:MAG: hypothetical protein K2M44_02215 [Clostridia bacterium]|nr:hypothetical protein [Clostridia bacterium]